MRSKLHTDRWSSYGENSGIQSMSELLDPPTLSGFEILEEFDFGFLAEISQDVSLVEWIAGATLFEEGSYLDLAFWIVDGEVELLLQRHECSAQPIFSTRVMQVAALADPASQPDSKPPPSPGPAGPGDQITMLATMDFDLSPGERLTLGPGGFFGEIGALNGWPQSVTARATTPLTVLQIRVPALRKLKRKSKALKRSIDDIYRKRVLHRHLQTTPLLRGCGEQVIAELASRVELVSCEPDEVVLREGEPADALILVRSGFVKLSQRVGDGELVLSYLSKGTTYGGPELLIDGVDRWQASATSVGYSELVRISAEDFREVLSAHPAVERRLWDTAVDQLQELGYAREHVGRADLVDFSLSKGLVQGNSVLVIDLERCTRCDDCVRACASTHGGRPRFVREGEKYEGFLITRSCYHCEDPVCLIGCPTGAIRRANVGDVVEIEDSICIGCSACAENCPYDAIVMHDMDEVWSDSALPKYLRGQPRQVASKCDLCHTSPAGPACVSSCPQECAFRITTLEEFDELLQRRTGRRQDVSG